MRILGKLGLYFCVFSKSFYRFLKLGQFSGIQIKEREIEKKSPRPMGRNQHMSRAGLVTGPLSPGHARCSQAQRRPARRPGRTSVAAGEVAAPRRRGGHGNLTSQQWGGGAHPRQPAAVMEAARRRSEWRKRWRPAQRSLCED
jgi:hypothetical protein